MMKVISFYFSNMVFNDIMLQESFKGGAFMTYKVTNEEDLVRLDKFLIDKLEVSRSKLQEMIKQNLVMVNGKPAKNSYGLRLGDEVLVTGELRVETSIKPEAMDLDIIYEDDDLMVINKPSGLVVHPAAGHYTDTLVNGLLAHTNALSSNNGDLRPGIVHRIDKDTSGLLIVAKNDFAHEALAKQLKDKTLSRVYVALVSGKINHDTGTIDAPIGRDPYDRKKMCVTDVNAKEAITHFRVLKRYHNATLIECQLLTGRTHQIRVHLAYIKHPIINDPVYGIKRSTTNFGQMLHASKISFVHPRTNKKMTFEADVPKEFKDILSKFENE